MTAFDTVEALPPIGRHAVVNLLYRLADDELVMGHRNSEWTGLAPILEEDIAFSSMAQDEMGHAQAYYELLHRLGEADPDTLAFGRKPRQFRCASLVSLPHGDWAIAIVRQFLYDVAEHIRLTALSDSSFTPLAQLARKFRGEEKYHLMHARTWLLRLGNANDDSRSRMQRALDLVYPHGMGLFEPTEADEPLAQLQICPREIELRTQWESAVAPSLVAATLHVDDNVQPAHGGRVGKHPETLQQLVEKMQSVYQIDPTAKW